MIRAPLSVAHLTNFIHLVVLDAFTKRLRLQDPGETIHLEQNTIGERAGQLDFGFLLHSPTGWVVPSDSANEGGISQASQDGERAACPAKHIRAFIVAMPDR
jgi:hypothetical protein